MDKWAIKYAVPGVGPNCSFICIGCAGPQLATAFGDELRLRNCLNTVAESAPRWGQLGCNGFIVLDAGGRVVCKATSAFLKVREEAFEHVETLVDAQLAGGDGALQKAAAAGVSSGGSSSSSGSSSRKGCGDDTGGG